MTVVAPYPPGSALADLPIVAPEGVPMGDLLAYHATSDADRPAVSFEGNTTSYAELDVLANRKARQLASLGVGHNDVVTVAVPNSLESYVLAFAISKLGATINIVSSALPAAELRAIVELARPRLIVGAAGLRIEGWPLLLAGADPDPAVSADPLPTRVAARWKIHTSGGSTGRPKLIVTRRAGAADPATPPFLQVPGDTVLNVGPLYHNAPYALSLSSLFAGNHVVEMGRFDALRALQLIERYRVNWVNFVPTMMSRVWRLPEEQRTAFDLSSLRVVWHMASSCPVWLKQAWIDWLGPDRIMELYGGSELFGSTVITGREWLEHKGSVGKVQPGARMRILDEAGQECAVGQVGEIYFLPDAGASSSYDYIGAQVKAVGDWQSYGDMGHVDADGYLYIADRRTDMIVAGGANIFPAEVEAAIDQHADVRSSIVIGLPDDDLGQRVHAIVQLTDEGRSRTGADELRTFLEERLVRYKIPRTFEFTADDLRDDAGKARRAALREERSARTH